MGQGGVCGGGGGCLEVASGSVVVQGGVVWLPAEVVWAWGTVVEAVACVGVGWVVACGNGGVWGAAGAVVRSVLAKVAGPAVGVLVWVVVVDWFGQIVRGCRVLASL